MLSGQMAGLTTVQYSGEPGSDAANIFVRGQATWNQSAPLIQVDGVERSMNDIDPNEIESISILKMLLLRLFLVYEVQMALF